MMKIPVLAKKLIKAPFHAVGMDLVRDRRSPKNGDGEDADMNAAFAPQYSPEEYWLAAAGIKTVLDVGAHKGEFAQRIRTMIPDAALVCFEPLEEPFARLTARFAGQKNFRAIRCALGEATGRFEMHRNEYAPSSS